MYISYMHAYVKKNHSIRIGLHSENALSLELIKISRRKVRRIEKLFINQVSESL